MDSGVILMPSDFLYCYRLAKINNYHQNCDKEAPDCGKLFSVVTRGYEYPEQILQGDEIVWIITLYKFLLKLSDYNLV